MQGYGHDDMPVPGHMHVMITRMGTCMDISTSQAATPFPPPPQQATPCPSYQRHTFCTVYPHGAAVPTYYSQSFVIAKALHTNYNADLNFLQEFST